MIQIGEANWEVATVAAARSREENPVIWWRPNPKDEPVDKERLYSDADPAWIAT
jgi:hypothetical protein